MKKILNTLYITTPSVYLALDGENILIKNDGEILGRLPLHNLEAIVTCGYVGASPKLMYKCAEKNISLTFLNRNGKFLARVIGETKGNVHLRKEQYKISEDAESLKYAKSFISGKIHNQRIVLNRAIRDYSLRIETKEIEDIAQALKYYSKKVWSSENKAELRGYEGLTSQMYFSVLDKLILNQKEDFYFKERSKRPPLDPFNSLLSFLYTILSYEIASSLEVVGLDPYVGFMHTDRAGRISLALDLIEELRAPVVDRMAITLVNQKQITIDDFRILENNVVLITDEGKKKIFSNIRNKKLEEITHPYLKEKIQWGMLPYVQSMLLARSIRGDLELYPPFLWK